MWFTREQFQICQELKQWGLEPRFEPGDVVARGFADLGFEEFQVLPGRVLLSLTAGTTSPLPEEHVVHFFWIPSVDEAVDLLERRGVECRAAHRHDGRTWTFQISHEGALESFEGESLHDAALAALAATLRRLYRS